jgi:hypothetical protein
LVSHADAATYKKKKRLHVNAYPKASSAYRNHDDDPNGYYEHRLEAVRFGSRPSDARTGSASDDRRRAQRSGLSRHRARACKANGAKAAAARRASIFVIVFVFAMATCPVDPQ